MASLPNKPNSGYFGKNTRKTKATSPDYTGKATIGEDTLAALCTLKASGKPVVLYLSGWKRTPQGGGEQYISLAVSPPQEVDLSRAGQQQQSKPAPTKAEDEDIPF